MKKTLKTTLCFGLSLLLTHNAKLDAVNEHSPLHQALDAKDITMALECINSNNSDLNDFDDNNYTALHRASQDGHIDIIHDIIHALLKNNVTIDIQNRWKNTSLHFALMHGQTESAIILINNKANPNKINYNKQSPLHIAVSKNNINAVQALIEAQANLNQKNKEEETPLHLALHEKNEEIALFLINSGADITIRNKKFNTPLHCAIAFKQKKASKQLIKRSAILNAKNFAGVTPLHYAVITNQTDIVKLLIKNGADLNIQDKHQATPVFYAIQMNYTDIAELLIENGADLNIQNDCGETLLHKASIRPNNIFTIKLLCENGADLTIKDKHNKTAHDVAIAFPDHTTYLQNAKDEYKNFTQPVSKHLLQKFVLPKKSLLQRAYFGATPIKATINNNNYLIDLYTIYKRYSEHGKIDELKEILHECAFNTPTDKEKTAILKLGLPTSRSQLHLQNNLIHQATLDNKFSDVVIVTKK
jgi:ankyrin repeat protein